MRTHVYVCVCHCSSLALPSVEGRAGDEEEEEEEPTEPMGPMRPKNDVHVL